MMSQTPPVGLPEGALDVSASRMHLNSLVRSIAKAAVCPKEAVPNHKIVGLIH